MQTISLVPEECTDDYLVFTTLEPHSPDTPSTADSPAVFPAVSSPDPLADSSQEDSTTPARFRLPLTADTRSVLHRLLSDVSDASGVNGSADSSSTDTTTAEAAPQSDDSDSSHTDNVPSVDNDKDSDDTSTTDATVLHTAGSDTATTEQGELLTAPSTPSVILTPREIQARIRGGESIEDLARSSGMSQGKIEPFAHPILAERERMTTVARQSHPVRQDGPSTLTLDDVLATAFTARGMDLSEATWNAYRNDARLWIITLTWTSGMSDVTAEWSYHSDGLSATTVARNEAATELVDPDFGRPSPGRPRGRTLGHEGSARSSSAMKSNNRSQESGQIHGLHTDGDPDFDYDDTAEDFDDATSNAPSSPEEEAPRGEGQPGAENDAQPHSHPSRAGGGRGRRTQRRRTGRMEIVGLDEHRSRRAHKSSAKESSANDDTHHHGGGPAKTNDGSNTNDGYHGSGRDQASDGHTESSDNEDTFLQHPDSESRPRRRRKAVTPHWEDVLLGVRTNRSDPPRNRANHTRDHD
ncbi:septation protein SepH [uncultured Corynebacterium sp.]|uniref:septation protein SepH n=1 Tax=uncultured Corynebacterium sp. TaxID=159447 RepID=UPI0025CC8014|nr:septation protein SepH [uncultured Corynebacterium sp.]